VTVSLCMKTQPTGCSCNRNDVKIFTVKKPEIRVCLCHQQGASFTVKFLGTVLHN